jgi:hypothetical protein
VAQVELPAIWPNRVVPVSVELVSLDVDSTKFLVGYLSPSRILSPVQPARDGQALGGCGPGDQIYDGLVVLTDPLIGGCLADVNSMGCG